MHILDELRNLHRARVVSESNRVTRKTGLRRVSHRTYLSRLQQATYQLIDERDESLEVLLDSEMESIPILEVDWYCVGVRRASLHGEGEQTIDDASNFFNRQQTAGLRSATVRSKASKVATVEDGEHLYWLV